MKAQKKARMLAAAALLTAMTAARLEAQTYPSRPVEMIIPFTAGSGLDVNGRTIASALSEQLGQQVVVLNRDGAAGTIGFSALSVAQPDGQTIGFGPTTPISNAPYLVKGVRYDADSFEYICQIFETIFTVAVGPESRFKSMKDVLTEAKAKPGTITYGTAGLGSVPHLAMANLGRSLDVEFQHVPYRGDALLLPALLRKEIDLAITAVASIREQPTIRALAVFSDERNDSYPDAPKVAEFGVTRSVPPGQVGIYAPKGLPRAVQTTLEKACEAATKSPQVTRVIATTGQRPKYLNSVQYRQLTLDDYKFKGELIRALGLLNQ
jgi:tripartite-type tricarboxylate transporter receptor subunit TctC